LMGIYPMLVVYISAYQLLVPLNLNQDLFLMVDKPEGRDIFFTLFSPQQ
jgi:hypothetical protein